ncbi:MliC family protein [Paragemmobacter straminiformis]|uniref:MliC family protein n=1 Tax=Paragemmobacter straminiformis TaxID=2045119 RepID=A0A842I7K3_9RHOB|nr:MliC family protein [Gemmobacter straminiformis]
MKAALLALVVAAAPAYAETQATTARYACDRGVTVPVVYVNGDDPSLAVLVVEGSQILLYSEPAASGARYGWPSDGSSYVWWTKGDTATLYWKDGEAGSEVPLLSGCTLQN